MTAIGTLFKFRNNPSITACSSTNCWQLPGISKNRRAAFRCNSGDAPASGRQSRNPLQVGTARIAVEPGWHFSSRYPGDPARAAVYDFLPDALLSCVVDLQDFRRILVFDKWAGNADGPPVGLLSDTGEARRRKTGSNRSAARPGFVAQMIDHS